MNSQGPFGWFHTLRDLPILDRSFALFLDFDGTLVDIAPTPNDVVLSKQIKQALCEQSAALSGALALVSGRTITDLDSYLTPLQLPMAGIHGAEMRLGNGGCIATLENSMADVREALAIADHRLCSESLEQSGVVIEKKPLGLSLHYRSAPLARQACNEAARSAACGFECLSVRPGKMVVEIVPACVNKGTAVERFLQDAPFRGRIPVCVGDDDADEAAFAAAQRLGGFGIRILDASLGLSTCARYRLQGPSVFREWLLADESTF